MVNKIFKSRPRLSPKKRWLILKRDNFRCVACGKNQEQSPLEIDHIIPISKGGQNIESNLQTLCRDCNVGKRNSYKPEDMFVDSQPTQGEKMSALNSFFSDIHLYPTFLHFKLSKDIENIQKETGATHSDIKENYIYFRDKYITSQSEDVNIILRSNNGPTKYQEAILRLLSKGITSQKEMAGILEAEGFSSPPSKISINLKWMRKKGLIKLE